MTSPLLLPRAEQLASLEEAQRAVGAGSGASVGSSTRAEFWRLRGLRRGAKKTTHRSREDLSALTRQGHYPPYERVVLREGGSLGQGRGGVGARDTVGSSGPSVHPRPAFGSPRSYLSSPTKNTSFESL